ncbi:MAG: hypothetical protein V2G42_04435 [bacterium JZ-2024 1]
MIRATKRWIFVFLLVSVLISCHAKQRKKIDIYQPPEPQRPILIMGFHAIGGSQSRVWQNYAISYFVAEDLRLNASGKIWLDPIVLRNFVSAFDTRLMARMPDKQDLHQMCDIFQCEDAYYIVWEDGDSGDRHIRIYRFGTEEFNLLKSESAPAENLIAAQRFIAKTVLELTNPGWRMTESASEGFIPGNPTAMQQAILGLYFSDTGWYNKALEFFKSAVRSDPAYEYGNLKISEILLAKDEANEALKYLLSAESRFSGDAYYLYLLARAYYYSGKIRESEKAIDECLKVAPGYQEALMLQAIIKGQAGKKRAERSAVGRFLQSNPRTGAQLAQAERYIRGFMRSPRVTVLANKLAVYQVYDPYFGVMPKHLFDRVAYVGEWTLGRLSRDIRRPGDLVVTPLGIAVWDRTARSILILDNEGLIRSEVSHPALLDVEGITFQPPHHLYLADPTAGAVFAVNLKAGHVSFVTKEIPRPRGVAVLRNHLYVTDAVNDVIWVITPSGTVLRKLDILRRGLNKEASPRLILATPSGTLLYEDDLFNRIIEITPDGKRMNSVASFGFGPDEIVEPVGLARANNGRILVTDWSDHRVKVFNSDGSAYAVFGDYGTLSAQFNRPTGVALLPDGRILVSDTENGRIQIFRWKESADPNRKT